MKEKHQKKKNQNIFLLRKIFKEKKINDFSEKIFF